MFDVVAATSDVRLATYTTKINIVYFFDICRTFEYVRLNADSQNKIPRRKSVTVKLNSIFHHGTDTELLECRYLYQWSRRWYIKDSVIINCSAVGTVFENVEVCQYTIIGVVSDSAR